MKIKVLPKSFDGRSVARGHGPESLFPGGEAERLPWGYSCRVLLGSAKHRCTSIRLCCLSHPAAKRPFNTNSTFSQSDEQPTVLFSKSRPPAPPKPQDPPPAVAPQDLAAADTRTRPTPAPRASSSQPKKPPAKRAGLKAPNCPPPLPPPPHGKAVPSAAQ